MSDRPQYPSYPGDDGSAAGPQPAGGADPAPPPYGQVPPAYGQPAYGQVPPAYGQPTYGQVPPAYGQPAYGQPPYGQPAHGYGQPFATPPTVPYAPTPTKAVFGLVLGIVSIVFCYLGALIGPVAIALSVMASREIDAAPPSAASGRGLATAGLVTGIVGTVIWVLLGALTIIGATVE